MSNVIQDIFDVIPSEHVILKNAQKKCNIWSVIPCHTHFLKMSYKSTLSPCNSADINEAAMQESAEMKRLETSWRDGAAGEDSANETQSDGDDSLMLSNTPRDCMYSDADFATNRYVEGWTKPAADAQLIFEDDSYVCGNKGYPSIKILHINYKAAALVVPAQLTIADKSTDRKENAYDYNGLPESIRTAKRIMLRELEERFFKEDPNSNDLTQMYLDPTIKPAMVQLVGE